MTLVNASVIEIPSGCRGAEFGLLKGKHRLAGRAFFNGSFSILAGANLPACPRFREADFETAMPTSQASG